MSNEPWTRQQLTNALRRAGWVRLSGSTSVYVSPDDKTLHFNLDEYRPGLGVQWRYFANRRELPATTRPSF